MNSLSIEASLSMGAAQSGEAMSLEVFRGAHLEAPARSPGPIRSKVPERHTPRHMPLLTRPLPLHSGPDKSGLSNSEGEAENRGEEQKAAGAVRTGATLRKHLPELARIHEKESYLEKQLREIDDHLERRSLGRASR